jgi:hypothetical protein
MGRRPIGTRAFTNAEKQARRRARLAEAGGREVTVALSAEEAAALDRIRAQIPSVDSDADAMRYALHLLRRDGGI